MLILINARCADCHGELNDTTGNMVIEWPAEGPLDWYHPHIYMRCKNRAICLANQQVKENFQ